jgi:hypothetical protein
VAQGWAVGCVVESDVFAKQLVQLLMPVVNDSETTDDQSLPQRGIPDQIRMIARSNYSFQSVHSRPKGRETVESWFRDKSVAVTVAMAECSGLFRLAGLGTCKYSNQWSTE